MRSFFEPAFLRHIPDDLLAVADQVRAATGIPVTVKAMLPAAAEKDAYARPPAVADIDGFAHSITIIVNSELVQPSHVAHELIHLRRYLLESVCMLWPAEGATPYDVNWIVNVDNSLEHLLVVPEEIAASDGAEQWWIAHYEALVEHTGRNWLGQTMHLLFLRAVLPTQHALRARCEEFIALTGVGQLEKASLVSDNALAALPSKRKLIDVVRPLLPPELQTRMALACYAARDGRIALRDASLAG